MNDKQYERTIRTANQRIDRNIVKIFEAEQNIKRDRDRLDELGAGRRDELRVDVSHINSDGSYNIVDKSTDAYICEALTLPLAIGLCKRLNDN